MISLLYFYIIFALANFVDGKGADGLEKLLCKILEIAALGKYGWVLSPPLYNPFPNKPLVLRVYRTSLLKTPWEQEKLLETSNFSFSQSVFYPFPAFTRNSKLSSANSSSLESKICRLGKG